MDDKALIEMFFERSEQAISSLSAKYGGAAKAVARNILADERDAEECLSDALLGVWNSVPPRRPESMKAYLLALTRNQALDRYHALTARKRNSYYDAALDELEACLPGRETAESALEAKVLAEAVNAFLAKLSTEDRRLFIRRYWLGEGVSELAARLSLSPKRTSLRLFRIRERLKNHLLKEGVLEWTER